MIHEKSSSKDCRIRNYATVVYPDSAPDNWVSILSEQFVPAFISPLHDRDINPDGEAKKAHYHVIVMFDGKKSIEQARALFNLICGVGCEAVQSIRGYARYLCHLDNPEKAQYSPDDVKALCGSDYMSVCSLVIDKYKAIDEMMDYIDEHHICSYRDLLKFVRKERKDWFRVLCDNGTYVILEYIKSAAWTDGQLNVNKDTGEVIDS